MSQPVPLDLEDETLAIIARHRPDLTGKSLEECRDILRSEYPRHGMFQLRECKRQKRVRTQSRGTPHIVKCEAALAMSVLLLFGPKMRIVVQDHVQQ
jgi:hypothetical protein